MFWRKSTIEDYERSIFDALHPNKVISDELPLEEWLDAHQERITLTRQTIASLVFEHPEWLIGDDKVRSAEIINQRYGVTPSETNKQIGKRYNISEGRVKQIVEANVKSFSRHLTEQKKD